MNIFSFIGSSLRYFWKKHLFLALGIAVSAAVLTGALIVGDSVAYSLNRIVEKRLGTITWTITAGDRYFSSMLGTELMNELESPVASLLRTDGVAIASGGSFRVNNIRTYGIDSVFGEFISGENIYADIQEDEAILSENLSELLQVKVGDELLLRMTRASAIPLNAPFVSDADNIISVRVRIKGIAGEDELGFFNLQNSQTAPYNIFLKKSWMQDLMEMDDRANMLLISNDNIEEDEIYSLLDKHMSLADAGLSFQKVKGKEILELRSKRVFIDQAVADALNNIKMPVDPVLTYFVNRFQLESKQTPYSFITTDNSGELSDDEIIINRWLADDLSAKKGDSLEIEYFVVGALRELSVEKAFFIVSEIIEMDDPAIDPELMPDIPGMSNAGNCRDWEAGVPVDLESIRDKDEDYWTRYKGTPKAIISLERAEQLWANRFGTYTSFRFAVPEQALSEITGAIVDAIEPASLGFLVKPVREQSEYAAVHGYDFTQLFGGLSFFLLLAAILLAILLFLLNIEERKEQLFTLSSMGIPRKTIKTMLVSEGMLVAVVGSLLGMVLALYYNRLVFSALNGVWKDIVRTDMLEVRLEWFTFFKGFFISLVISGLTLFLAVSSYLSKKGKQKDTVPDKQKYRLMLIFAFVMMLISPGFLLIRQFISNEVYNPSVFFLSGGLLLLAGLTGTYIYFSHGSRKLSEVSSIGTLAYRNSVQRKSRSLAIVFLFSIGTFLVISTGSNRKDLFVNAEQPANGTGGFMYYAESTIPVLHNLNEKEVRFNYGLDKDYSFLQIRKAEGDDASCLNLNRITNPAILGVDPEELDSRFTFVSSVDHLSKAHPWRSLDIELEEGIFPAIADETVIKWGLGMKVGDTLWYKNAEGEEFGLLLVGGLAPSIFQGSVMISEANFLQQFPSSSGTTVFLVEGNHADTAIVEDELRSAMRDYGWSMTYTGERLAEFSSVTNTYLSIFLVMGALGLLIGTIGLAIILYRSVIERNREIALLKALGFSYRYIRRIIGMEYSVLLLSGIFIGVISSVIATLPSFLGQTGISFSFILFMLLVLLINGFVWIWWISSLALRKQNLNKSLRTE